ncbi:unnamed protein product [Eruca vesicaria subsp. sativa]|uniref:Late embryogenesis abundant protein LEA-2 subgroup domain-containing protein n=1 Tax=Eruca vesicaria subsp. sativa TaxID=29727 RepID=A0ABC8KTP9_ERUVS|nr:unnamed protein product [Eruca vesicaria subsp. sativa]
MADDQRSPPKNNDVFITDMNIRRTKNQSIDITNDNISKSSRSSVDSQRPIPPPTPPPPSPPGTYIFQLPKEQIYRLPPPENARRYEDLSRRKLNRSSYRRCFCYSLAALLVLVTLAAVLVGIFFLVCRPHKPMFSVSGVSIAGVNLTSLISPSIKINLRAENVNKFLGLVYGGGGSAAVIFYDGVKLGDGELTPFVQPADKVTETETTLRGTVIELASSTREGLKEAEEKGNVAFDLRVKAPFKFKVRAVTMWKMVVTVDCKVTVDKLTLATTVITENCVTEDIVIW